MTVIIVGLVVVAMFIFRGESPGRISEEAIFAQRASFEQAGLLLPEPYLAKRAFQMEEFEDEGSHYYIELDDGGVLFLSGQYLYEYEPVFRRDRLERPRSFPCTRFSLRRHKEDGHLVDIRCEGPALEPEILAPADTMDDFENERYPEDQTVVRDKSYDELKAERVAAIRSLR
jgi:hypothetical protein